MSCIALLFIAQWSSQFRIHLFELLEVIVPSLVSASSVNKGSNSADLGLEVLLELRRPFQHTVQIMYL